MPEGVKVTVSANGSVGISVICQGPGFPVGRGCGLLGTEEGLEERLTGPPSDLVARSMNHDFDFVGYV